jgi:hypothetical protein
MIVRHDGQHRVARPQPIAPPLVEQVAGAGDRVLQHREWGFAAPAAAPIVARAAADLIAGAGRHRVQPMAAARQGDGPHDRSAGRQFLEHRITHESTNVSMTPFRWLQY